MAAAPTRSLGELLGAGVAEYFALPESLAVEGNILSGNAHIFAELLEPTSEDVEVLARYGTGNGWLQHQPAAVSREVGAGRISYLGCAGDHDLHQHVRDWVCQLHQFKQPILPVPQGVEVVRRRKGSQDIIFCINHSLEQHHLPLPGNFFEHLSNQQITSLDLKPSACAILTETSAILTESSKTAE